MPLPPPEPLPPPATNPEDVKCDGDDTDALGCRFLIDWKRVAVGSGVQTTYTAKACEREGTVSVGADDAGFENCEVGVELERTNVTTFPS